MKREEKYQAWDECIDRYLRGRMDGDERKAFEQEVDGDNSVSVWWQQPCSPRA